jgi:peptidoglycan/xylan/chitin deacetylase (PgdA/CDA1 family)
VDGDFRRVLITVLLVATVIVGACSSREITTPSSSAPPAVATTGVATSGTATSSTWVATTAPATAARPETTPPVTVPPVTVPPVTVPPVTVPPTTVSSTTASPAPASTARPSTLPATVPPTGPSVAVDRLPTSDRVIALTFDAGSDLGYTATVLDVLADRGVIASFGITGEFAAAHPDHVERMAREGHVVINHSYTHASFTGTSSDEVLLTTDSRQADLGAADAVLEPLVGGTTRPFWRPPFGDYDAGVLADVGAAGYAFTVMWTFDSLGWRGTTADEIVARVLARAEPGAIVVMHVGSESQDAVALPAVIDELRDAGYAFTTVRYLTGW